MHRPEGTFLHLNAPALGRCRHAVGRNPESGRALRRSAACSDADADAFAEDRPRQLVVGVESGRRGRRRGNGVIRGLGGQSGLEGVVRIGEPSRLDRQGDAEVRIRGGRIRLSP